jgi:hypothetical protein
MKKYRVTPIISIAVVTKGPVEIAGSKFNFSRNMGSTDATKQAKLIEEKMDKPTMRLNFTGE